MRRYRRTLEAMGDLRLYTEAGLRLIRPLIACYQALSQRWADWLASLDVSDQPYVFDYQKFRTTNAGVPGLFL
jgi:hypothetical protein